MLQKLWRYWKWLCMALRSTFVLLALLAGTITYFKSSAKANRDVIDECIDSGGTWDASTQECLRAG